MATWGDTIREDLPGGAPAPRCRPPSCGPLADGTDARVGPEDGAVNVMPARAQPAILVPAGNHEASPAKAEAIRYLRIEQVRRPLVEVRTPAHHLAFRLRRARCRLTASLGIHASTSRRRWHRNLRDRPSRPVAPYKGTLPSLPPRHKRPAGGSSLQRGAHRPSPSRPNGREGLIHFSRFPSGGTHIPPRTWRCQAETERAVTICEHAAGASTRGRDAPDTRRESWPDPNTYRAEIKRQGPSRARSALGRRRPISLHSGRRARGVFLLDG